MRRAAIAISTALIACPALFAGAAQAQDRYGPEATAGLTPVSYGADRPLLNWPGKQPAPSEETAEPPAPPPEPAPPPANIYTPRTASIYTPPPEPSPPPAPSPMAPPVSFYTPPQPPSPPVERADLPMRPLLPAPPVAPVASRATPAPAARIAHAAKPKSPEPAPKAPVAVAAATTAPVSSAPDAAEPPHRPWSPTGPGIPAHFYSTAREFGLKPDPDPVPLSPQFFADSAGADLAAPPPPLDPHAVPGSQTVGSTASANTPANRARAIALDTPSPDGSSN
jgi:hypothetical protein